MIPASRDSLNLPAKREKFTSGSKSNIDNEFILELAIERISEVRSLLALSRVNKRIRTAVFSENGLRCISYKHHVRAKGECSCSTDLCTILSGMHLKSDAQQSQEQNLMQGISWVWKVANKLNSVRISSSYYVLQSTDLLLIEKVVFKLTGLSVSEKRKIESIAVAGFSISESLSMPLMLEHRHTLKELWVYLDPKPSFKTQAFWEIVAHCYQLHSLQIFFSGEGFDPEVLNVLRKTPLKYLNMCIYAIEVLEYEPILQALCCENLCRNLQTIVLAGFSSSDTLAYMLKTNRIFENVKELKISFGNFIPRSPFNWTEFLWAFPIMRKLTFLSFYAHSDFRKDMKEFCEKFLFDLCDSSSPMTEMEIKIEPLYRKQAEEIMTATGNPDIKADEINVKKIDGLIETVVLQKGNAKLLFAVESKIELADINI